MGSSNVPYFKLTEHRNLSSARYPIPDVPVVYLVEPTAANLDLINQDLAKHLYSDAYINFLSSIPRPLMEDFAAQVAEAGTAESISQVYDQYLNFIVAEPDLFSLGLGKETYWALNSANAKDEEIDTLVERIVSGLFSVVVTMGSKLLSALFARANIRPRGDTNNTLSPWRCCRDDSRKTGPKTEGSYTELKGQSLLWSRTGLVGLGSSNYDANLKACPRHR